MTFAPLRALTFDADDFEAVYIAEEQAKALIQVGLPTSASPSHKSVDSSHNFSAGQLNM